RSPGGRLARVRAALAGPGRGRRRDPPRRHDRGVCRDQTPEVRGQAAAGGQRDPSPSLDFLRGGARPPQPLILAFIDEMRSEGYAVESILRVLRQQGLTIAARTYRAWKRPARIAARTVTDALVEDKIRDFAWTTHPVTEQVQLTPEAWTGGRSGSRCSAARKASPAPPAARWTGPCGPSASRASGGSRTSAPPSPARMGNGPVTCSNVIFPRKREVPPPPRLR